MAWHQLISCLVSVQRLQTRLQFQAVLNGDVVAKTQHFALHRNTLDALVLRPGRNLDPSQPAQCLGTNIWLGAMVPKKWAKRAVTRNAIKRQIYAVSSDFQYLYSQAAFVVRLRRDFPRAMFASATSAQLRAAVRSELQSLLQFGAAVQ